MEILAVSVDGEAVEESVKPTRADVGWGAEFEGIDFLERVLQRPDARALGERARRSRIALLVVLLALCNALASAPALALPSIAGGDGMRANTSAGGSPSATSADRELANDLPQGRHYCRPGEYPRERLEKERIRVPDKRDHATVRKTSGDRLGEIQPGGWSGCAVLPRQPVSIGISDVVNRVIQQPSHRTFDGRAPPVS